MSRWLPTQTSAQIIPQCILSQSLLTDSCSEYVLRQRQLKASGDAVLSISLVKCQCFSVQSYIYFKADRP